MSEQLTVLLKQKSLLGRRDHIGVIFSNVLLNKDKDKERSKVSNESVKPALTSAAAPLKGQNWKNGCAALK